MYKILIVEDNKPIAEALIMLLKRGNPDYELYEAGSVEKAILFWNEFSPDIVLLDITLQNRSGYEVLEEIKNSNAKIIITSAHEEIDASKGNIINVFKKPYDFYEIEKYIREILSSAENN